MTYTWKKTLKPSTVSLGAFERDIITENALETGLLSVLQKENSLDETSYAYPYRISNIYDCMRKIYLKHYYPERESARSASSELVMSVGKYHEDKVLRALKSVGILRAKGVSISVEITDKSDFLILSGTIDGIIHENTALEIKNTSKTKYTKVYETNKPIDKHVAQLMWYIHWTREPFGKLCYVSRDSVYKGPIQCPQHIMLNVPYDTALIKKMSDWFFELKRYISDKRCPDGFRAADALLCTEQHCNFAVYCKSLPFSN